MRGISVMVLSAVLGFAGMAGMAVTVPVMAGAAPVNAKDARKMLFPAKGIDYRVASLDWLSAADIATLDKLPAIMKTQKMPLKYYGAIAAAPANGISARTTLFAMDYHSLEAAQKAALAGCNGLRKKKGKPCAIVATVRPKGWEARPLQLNVDATRGFRKFRRWASPKALAISPLTGEWAMMKGADAIDRALADCNAAAKGAKDCIVAIQD